MPLGGESRHCDHEDRSGLRVGDGQAVRPEPAAELSFAWVERCWWSCSGCRGCARRWNVGPVRQSGAGHFALKGNHAVAPGGLAEEPRALYRFSCKSLGMPHISHAGAVNIEYSHFPVGELWEPGFERRDDKPDFQTSEAVIVVPGHIIVRSRVQEHTAPVVLALGSQQGQAPGAGWELLASVAYRPVYTGRMAAFDTTNGPARSAGATVRVFGQRADPGKTTIDLDPSRTYDVQVWAQGRSNSCERFDDAVPGADTEGAPVLEAYLIVFTPSGTQEPPSPAARESRRDRLARTHGRPPLNSR